MFVKSILAVAFSVATVAAQGSTANSTIDPNSVDYSTRSSWCLSQENVCMELCGNEILNGENTCNPVNLNATCTCSNGTAPGLQYYSGSLDSFICQQVYQNCLAASGEVLAAQKVCIADQMANCGTQDAANYTAPSSTTSSSSSASSTSATAASTSSATTSTSKAAAATLMAMGRDYGSGVVAAGVAAAFGLLL